LLLLVAVCCWVVLLGALFRLTSIKLICGQQNSQLGNNWATNIGKKVELGNKKEKEKCTETQQKQALNKQKKVNYFPIQHLPFISMKMFDFVLIIEDDEIPSVVQCGAKVLPAVVQCPTNHQPPLRAEVGTPPCLPLSVDLMLVTTPTFANEPL